MDLLPQARLDALLQSFGREVRANRIRRGWSRSDLADAAKVSEKQVGKIERGERGQLSEAWRIAEALDREFSKMIASAEEEIHQAVLQYGSEHDALRLVQLTDELVSEHHGNVDDAIAALEEKSIAGEQESRNET